MGTFDFVLLLFACVGVLLLIVALICSICDCKIARYKVEIVLNENKRLKEENITLKAKVKKYIRTGK